MPKSLDVQIQELTEKVKLFRAFGLVASANSTQKRLNGLLEKREQEKTKKP